MAQAKNPGWFSRRHQDGVAHQDARARHAEEDEKKINSAKERAEYHRSPADALAHLDAILGKGVGAVKERAKLAAKLG
jgi:hypothetical protein